MTALDYVVIAILAIFGIVGFWRGLVSQLASLLAIIAGFVVARTYYREVMVFLNFTFEYGHLAAFAVTYVAVFLLVRVAGMIIEFILRAVKLSLFNRFLGLFLGAVKGAILCLVIVYLLFLFYPGGERIVTRSPAGRYFLRAGQEVMTLIPDDVRKKLERAGKSVI
ncbi:MAG: CvpA family protein [Deltaproteobacteria bacterium]|nr:MAG: CvpA family protein [Deltaproteobacteria bacterium]